MNRISELIMALIRVLIIILVPIMTIVVFAQVVMRYVFNSPFFWAEELAAHMLIWLSCLGAAYAVRTGENIAVEIFPKRMPLVMDLFVLVSVMIFFSITVFYAFQWCISEWTQTSAAMGIRITWLYASILVCFGVALFFAVELLLNKVGVAFSKGLFVSMDSNVNKRGSET